MRLTEKFSQFERFSTDWRRLFGRGLSQLLVGAALAAAAVFNPGGSILHAGDFSWLPVAAFVVLFVGLLECLDAAVAKELRDFFVHLQHGVLDVVTAGLVILSIGGDAARLSLLLVAYLLVKAILRIVMAYAAQLPQRGTTVSGAAISMVLGLLMWAQWPTSAAWFLAFCVSVDIGLRGWSLMMFALWLSQRKQPISGGAEPPEPAEP